MGGGGGVSPGVNLSKVTRFLRSAGMTHTLCTLYSPLSDIDITADSLQVTASVGHGLKLFGGKYNL
jgi:hypothetical protein